MSFDGNVTMPKDTSLPGFPNAITCSLDTLKYKYDWTDNQLQWVLDNWIQIDEDQYARPDSKPVLTEELNSSGEDNKDEPLLRKVLDRTFPLDRNANPCEELSKGADKETTHIPHSVFLLQKKETMSVIANKMNETVTGQRIAFAGCMASGKSFSAKVLKKKWNAKTHILSLSTRIKNLVFGDAMFDHRDGYQMVGTVGRQIDPECWVNMLSKDIKAFDKDDNIIVDDIRYENELIALRSMGFKIIYMDTSWDERLKRIATRYKDNAPAFNDFVRWFTHESEVQLKNLPESIFDKVIKTPGEFEKWSKENWGI